MSLYSSSELMQWFEKEWPNHSDKKLDMGKGCIRFKKPDAVPFDLIGKLISRMSPAE